MAIIAPRFPPFIGGVEEYCRQLAKGLASLGYNVTVLTAVPHTYKGLMTEMSNYEVRRFRDLSPVLPMVSPGLLRYFSSRRTEFDIVVNNGYQLPLSVMIGVRSHPYLILSSHFHGIVGRTAATSVLHRLYKPLGRIMIMHSRIIICGSNFEAGLLEKAFPEAAGKLRVIREGIQPVRCCGVKRENHRILTVCRLERYKGVQHIIQTLPFLPEFSLDTVGDGPFREGLAKLSRDNHVFDRVKFYGFVGEDSRDRLFCSASVFVLLSKQEAFGATVGQALSAGVPCIVLRENALSEWVDNKNCFGVIDPTDHRGLADLIRKTEQTTVTAYVPSWNEYVLSFASLIPREKRNTFLEMKPDDSRFRAQAKMHH